MTNVVPGVDPARANTPAISRGYTKKGNKVVSWDVLSYCLPDECPMREVCPYKKRSDVKCMVELKYVNSVFDLFIGANMEDMDAIALNRAGLMLIPLYHQLVKLKIAAYGVRNPIVVLSNKTITIHPVYKETREVMKTINSILKDTFKSAKPVKEDIPPEFDPVFERAMEQGDPDQYEDLYGKEGD